MRSQQATILVVDDELFFRNLYQDLLSDEDYRVEVCGNGDDAIVRMQQDPVDVVLTDMVMPGKCGLEVLRIARLQPNPPEVILVTGYASVESAIQALKNGARDYLVKPFNPDELKHLVHNCLEQRRLLTENQTLKAQIQLFQTGQTLSSLIDLNRLLPQALDALLRETGASSGFGFTVKPGAEPQLSVLRNVRGDSAVEILQKQLSRNELATDFHLLQRRFPDDVTGGVKPPWFLPLGESNDLKGGLVLSGEVDPGVRKLSLADLRYLSEQIILGFENACRFQDAQELMYTDDLTGLYNHRYMQVAMEHEIRRSQRYGLQFSLLFLDLDRFKEINDQHGHLAGSAALQEVADLMRQCVRDVDTLFRFGGDEFAAMLVETDGRTAHIVGERIRRTIDEHVFLTDQNKASHLTVTAGYATFPVDAVEKEQLIEKADKAMYAGKETRNVISGIGKIAD